MWGGRGEPKFVNMAECDTDVILPILQIIKLRPRVVMWDVPDHPAGRSLREHSGL